MILLSYSNGYHTGWFTPASPGSAPACGDPGGSAKRLRTWFMPWTSGSLRPGHKPLQPARQGQDQYDQQDGPQQARGAIAIAMIAPQRGNPHMVRTSKTISRITARLLIVVFISTLEFFPGTGPGRPSFHWPQGYRRDPSWNRSRIRSC